MMAGLPGTGLGGVFYILLVIWMVIREAWFSSTRASNRARWVEIMGLAFLALGIVGALWLEGWLLLRLFAILPKLGLQLDGYWAGGKNIAVAALAPAIAAAPFAILTALLAGIHLRRLLRRRSRVAAHAG